MKFYMVTETSPCVAEIGFSDATSVSLWLSQLHEYIDLKTYVYIYIDVCNK